MITPPTTGPTIWPSAETVVSVPNLPMRAIELSRLRHDALSADRCRRMPDAERSRGDGDGPDLLCGNESEGRHRPDRKAEDEQDRGVVPLGPPAEADGEHDRRNGEACGRHADGGAVSTEREEAVRRHRPGQSDRDLEQEDAGDGADEPQRRKRAALADQNFQPRSGVATSTSTPSGSRNLKNRGGSACSAP